MKNVLRTEKLTRILPNEIPVTLVQDIDITIGQSEFVAIMGPSGSGKSSLLYLLGLLDSPTSGKLWLDEEETSQFSDNRLAQIRLQRIGFVFQFHFLLAEFSSLENVMLPMRKLGQLSEQQAKQKASQLLENLGMQEHQHKLPCQLSGGQRQRVAVARALANDPVLILADEPTGALDTKSSVNVRTILHDLSQNHQCAIIAVTHDAEFAKVADRQIHLIDGRLVPR
ncbi:ABC transporter ATP-binding protein [uncultured Tolumonas sp.]|uniref:ABC transporter ATP-binding protein n=1 Tax=uncultured Tolumonas sp. TaxID=263765 RepID=UPI00292EC844|nr:ABC transporter ATP-binding protein [uncultured Tolumonas sp.]